jgi:hypothetical protein
MQALDNRSEDHDLGREGTLYWRPTVPAFQNGARSTLVAFALVAASAGACAAASPPASTENCFLTSDWEGWKSPSPKVIYLRVRVNTVYRLDLSASSEELQEPDVHLISRVRGSDWICSPLDLDLAVADDHGVFREPLIVKSITRLTPDEAKAIPGKFRP